jgi:hypothetical protein
VHGRGGAARQATFFLESTKLSMLTITVLSYNEKAVAPPVTAQFDE